MLPDLWVKLKNCLQLLWAFPGQHHKVFQTAFECIWFMFAFAASAGWVVGWSVSCFEVFCTSYLMIGTLCWRIQSDSGGFFSFQRTSNQRWINVESTRGLPTSSASRVPGHGASPSCWWWSSVDQQLERFRHNEGFTDSTTDNEHNNCETNGRQRLWSSPWPGIL